MRRLREATGVRIAGGEMTRELYEFRELITGGCLDVLQPDVALVGGITGLRRVAYMAQEHNLDLHAPHLDQRHGRGGKRAPDRRLWPTRRCWSIPTILPNGTSTGATT